MKPLFALFLVLFYYNSIAQNLIILKGRVTGDNRQAVPFANVYINSTSFVTQTDEKVFFSLRLNSDLPKIELVASSVGYKTFKKSLLRKDLYSNLDIVLEVNTIGEVKITAKRDGEWRRKWQIFKNGILGKSIFTSDCTIENMEAIRLAYDDENKLNGTTIEPIIIKNKALGYQIVFDMNKFLFDGGVNYFGGGTYFKELKPTDEKQANEWQENRKRAYRTSSRNFLEALTENQARNSGFEIFEMSVPWNYFSGEVLIRHEINEGRLKPLEDSKICFRDSTKNEYRLISTKTLLIIHTNQPIERSIFVDYPYEFSTITMPYNYITFTKNGWIKNYNGVLFKNFWGREGFSNLLPDDYRP